MSGTGIFEAIGNIFRKKPKSAENGAQETLKQWEDKEKMTQQAAQKAAQQAAEKAAQQAAQQAQNAIRQQQAAARQKQQTQSPLQASAPQQMIAPQYSQQPAAQNFSTGPVTIQPAVIVRAQRTAGGGRRKPTRQRRAAKKRGGKKTHAGKSALRRKRSSAASGRASAARRRPLVEPGVLVFAQNPMQAAQQQMQPAQSTQAQQPVAAMQQSAQPAQQAKAPPAQQMQAPAREQPLQQAAKPSPQPKPLQAVPKPAAKPAMASPQAISTKKTVANGSPALSENQDSLAAFLAHKAGGNIDAGKLSEIESKVNNVMQKYSIPQSEVEKRLDGASTQDVLNSIDRLVSLMELEKKANISAATAHKIKTAIPVTESVKQKAEVVGIAAEIKKHQLVTEFDGVYSIIKQQGRVGLGQIAKSLKLPMRKVEDCCAILRDKGLIEVVYPAIGEPMAQSMDYKDRVILEKLKKAGAKGAAKKGG
ncbi:MAG TPA: hypothetical protein VJH23_03540 [archaeon]|nr:hypothetical protein [archaeon]